MPPPALSASARRRNVLCIWALAFLSGLQFHLPFLASHVVTTLGDEGVAAVGALVSLRAVVQMLAEVSKEPRRTSSIYFWILLFFLSFFFLSLLIF